jgi:hypothetical protein
MFLTELQFALKKLVDGGCSRGRILVLKEKAKLVGKKKKGKAIPVPGHGGP